MSSPQETPLEDRNARTARIVVLAVVSMVGLAFASVPAYKVFCQVTGWGGTTQRADTEADRILDRSVTVRFDGVVGRNLPWKFKPEQVDQTIRLGETAMAFYRAENLSDRPVTGRATFNVSPAKAGIYFRKIDCFCFTEQTLQPGEVVSMPVAYFVDPDLADDRNLDEVETITLSYTFFVYDDGATTGQEVAVAVGD